MTGPRPALVIGGAGAVGSLFAGLLAGDGDDVCVADRRAGGGPGARPGIRVIGADALQPDDALTAELQRADLVLLALPEEVALRCLPGLVPRLRPGALLVDVLSVKTGIAARLRDCAPQQPALSLNPMFAPSLGVEGRPVAAVVLHDHPAVQDFLGRLRGWGALPVELTADRHDRLAAATQALTHAAVLAAGSALHELGADVRELAAVGPPPHQLLLALLARILSGTPEAYWDVQAGNPYAGPARQALAAGVQRLDDLVRAGEEKPFQEFAGDLRQLLGGHLDGYAQSFTRAVAATTGKEAT